jgi:hypothetical protein
MASTVVPLGVAERDAPPHAPTTAYTSSVDATNDAARRRRALSIIPSTSTT